MQSTHAACTIALVASIALGAGAAIASTPTDIGTQMHSLSDGVAKISLSRRGPAVLADYLTHEAQQRNLTELFVIDRAGRVLLSVKGPSAPAYIAPDSRILADAKTGQVVRLALSGRLESALMKLDSLNDAYLLVVRPG